MKEQRGEMMKLATNMKLATLVGAGALGSHLVQFIRNLPIELRVVDDDRVETKNILGQLHPKPHVGKLKVESLKQTMAFLYGVKLTAIPYRLTKDNVQQLLGGADFVVDALDNSASRQVVQSFVREHRIPCLHGALAPDGSFGRVIWESSGFVIDNEDVAGAPTCEGGDFLPFIAVVAAFMARSVQEFLKSGKEIGYSITPAGAFVI
jgi:predicted ThiF/HesA family dinucleotide-utilizing enzyme